MRLAPKKGIGLEGQWWQTDVVKGSASFLRTLPRTLENNARYLLFQHIWEEEGLRLVGVRCMLL